MAYESEVLSLMSHLIIADKHIIASLMSNRWQEGTSSVNNAYKALTNLVGMGKLEKGDGFFRIPGCKSEYKEHSQLLSKVIAEIIKTNLVSKIMREPNVSEAGLRPDAIVLLARDNKGLCFILEVANNEKEDYLCQKVNTWLHWDSAKEALSELLGLKISCFDIVVAGNAITGTFEFQDYLKEVLNE